jgi:hypothetical protein
MTRQNKYKTVYKKGRSISNKIDRALKKYDKFLESAREKGSNAAKEYKKIKKVVRPRIEETRNVIKDIRVEAKPTLDYVNKTRSNIHREFNREVNPNLNLKPAKFPDRIDNRGIWSGKPTGGFKGKLPKLF